MRLRKLMGVTMVALVFMATASAKAKAADSRNLLVPYDATVAGSHISSGTYKVKWEAHSPQATVTFSKGNKVVTTAEGKVVDRGQKYASNQVVYDQKDDGSRVIQELRFRGSTQVIVFED